MNIKAILAASALTLVASAASAQTWPARPVNIIVPSAPGGSTDLSARLVGEALARLLGQPVVIENRPGASGNLGTEAVARAKPDGHTLLMQYSGYHVGNPALFPQVKWSPTRDFAPVAMVMRAPHVIAVGPTVKGIAIPEGARAYTPSTPAEVLRLQSVDWSKIAPIRGRLVEQFDRLFAS